MQPDEQTDAREMGKNLSQPFPETDIEWRIGQCGKHGNGIWAMVLAYVTNRAIMQRLDDVVGPGNWKNEFKPGPDKGVVCGISIRINGEWVTKWDGAENTQVESVKGGLSDSMKRAAVQWGIGRYLYKLEESFLPSKCISTDKVSGWRRASTKDKTVFYWQPPDLPAWALPEGDQPKPPDHNKSTKDYVQDVREVLGKGAKCSKANAPAVVEWVSGGEITDPAELNDQDTAKRFRAMITEKVNAGTPLAKFVETAKAHSAPV